MGLRAHVPSDVSRPPIVLLESSNGPDSVADAALVYLAIVLFPGMHLDMVNNLLLVLRSYHERAVRRTAFKLLGHWCPRLIGSSSTVKFVTE